MALKHRNGPFRAWIESIKSAGKRSQKVEFKTWQGQIVEVIKICLFVRVYTTILRVGPKKLSRAVAYLIYGRPQWVTTVHNVSGLEYILGLFILIAENYPPPGGSPIWQLP